jgi:alkyl sulfatase BDS1-like metallo-beta-lactamase superfamily hydrolase
VASLHNIYTLRGAPVRDPLRWSKYIADALYRFGLEAEVMLPRITGRAGAMTASRKFSGISATSMRT